MSEDVTEILETEEGEPSPVARRIRVYKGKDEDFYLDLPEGCRLTFGYFVPSSGERRNSYDDRHGAASALKTTCLRVYMGKGNGNQLAAFLGVHGFRDESIKLTKLVQRYTVERRMQDDGEGTVEWGGKEQRELTVTSEDDIPF